MNIFIRVRGQLKKTQAQMGEALGVSQGHISHIENGRRKPTVKIAKRFVRAARKAGISLTLEKIL